MSAIEWTDARWNPVTGCTQLSPGCDHCYALTFAERFRGVSGHPYEQGFDLKLWPGRLISGPRRGIKEDTLLRVLCAVEQAENWREALAKVAKLVERWGIEFPAIPELDISGVDVGTIEAEDIIPVF
jgi:hypothetical protein